MPSVHENRDIGEGTTKGLACVRAEEQTSAGGSRKRPTKIYVFSLRRPQGTFQGRFGTSCDVPGCLGPRQPGT